MNTYNDPVPDFILNRSQDEQISLPFGGSDNNDPIPDFIKQNQTELVPSTPERPKFNRKDFEVQTQLGIDYDDSFSSNPEEVKSYVDSLSDEDYATWEKRREEGYSLDARKALMDNKDLINTKESGNLKYIINTPKLDNWALQFIQNTNEGYEQLHPWLTSAEEWLDQANVTLEENLGKEKLMNQWIDKNDPYNRLGSQAEGAINNYENFVNMVQIPKVLAQGFNTVAGKAINAVDQIANLVGSVPAEVVDLYQRTQGKEPIFNIQYGENRSNPIGSYVNIIEDALGAGFVAAYPVATYFFSLLGAQNEDISKLEELVFQDKPGQAIDWLLSRQTAQDLIEIAGLNSKDQNSLRQALIDGLLLTIGSITSWGGKKLESSDIIKLQKEAAKKADLYAKQYAKQQMQENYTMKDAAGTLPEGTEVLNKKGKSIARSTSEGGQFTPRGSLETIGKGVQGYAKGFAEYMRWFYKNRGKWMVERNPNTPVGELPDMKSVAAGSNVVEGEKVQEEITPERQQEIDEKGFYTDEKPIVKETTKVKPKEQGTTIGEFIKKNINKITGKKGGLDKDMVTKLQTSKELQNEYISTIDPYIRENGANNPAGVIQEQLTSLLETAKDQILARKLNNQAFRRGQKQYKVQISEQDKIRNQEDDKKLKDIEKLLNKKFTDPEKFLEYLLNLPEEKVNTLNELIPDFSKNLGLIKDTLDLTKAITSTDLLGKFLKFKSTFGTRNKNILRKMLYKYLNDKYAEYGIKRNMYEVEQILNNMSEEELVELETELREGKVRPFESDAEIADLEEKGYMPTTWLKANENIEDIMNSTRPGTNKTTREYLKEKGVQLSLTNEWGLRKIGGNIQAAYSARFDRILMKEENNPYKGIIYHEYGHRVLSQLGTTQIMDIITYISKRDHISAEAAFERRAEYFRNYLQYNNIDGKKYLIKNVGEDIANKIDGVMEKTKKEIWDLFDLDDGERNINQIMSDVKHDTPEGKDITSRRPEPLMNDMIGNANPIRYEWLREIDPDIDIVETNPYLDQQLEIKFKDGHHEKRSDFRKKLTEEQLAEIDTYETDIVQDFVDERLGRKKGFEGEGNFDYDTLKNEKDLTNILMEKVEKGFKMTKESLGLDAFTTADYLKTIKDIDPDIIGLEDKDGQVYVKYIIDSNRERWELPNRPGYVEVKEVPAKDYFTEEELKKLPKDLQDKINNNAD